MMEKTLTIRIKEWKFVIYKKSTTKQEMLKKGRSC